MEITLEKYTFSINGNLSDSMSDKEFFDFCQQNELLRIERDENKQIIIMAPTSSSTGIQNANILGEVINWNKNEKKGFCFDSSTAFTLSDKSVRSPDVSWITKAKWTELNEKEKQEFAPICPDFIIELRSKSDNLKYLTKKMYKWIENGCRLAWLIDPANQKVFIYRKNKDVEEIHNFNSVLSGEDVLPGFELHLSILL